VRNLVPENAYSNDRDKPYGGDPKDNPYDSVPYHNRNIDKWWSDKHDRLISELIAKHQWYWHFEIADAIDDITPKEILEALHRQNVWYNKVMRYAETRTRELGLDKAIREARRKECPLCNNFFIETSLPPRFVTLMGGPDRIDFCTPCFRDSVYRYTDRATPREILEYLKAFTNILGQIPSSNFEDRPDFLINLNYDQRVALLRIFKNRPSVKCVKNVFGSWLNALIKANILVDGTRETPRGTHTIAQDGNICLSLGEKTLCDYFYKHGISYKKEVKYPEANYKADFQVGDIFIEYFGLVGDSKYDTKIDDKQKMCQKHGIKLISLYPKDLISLNKLRKKLVEAGLNQISR
jgi:hypothetical protein